MKHEDKLKFIQNEANKIKKRMEKSKLEKFAIEVQNKSDGVITTKDVYEALKKVKQ